AVDGGDLFQQAIGAIRRTVVDKDQLKCVPHLLHNGFQSVIEGFDTFFFVMERNHDRVFWHIPKYTAAGSENSRRFVPFERKTLHSGYVVYVRIFLWFWGGCPRLRRQNSSTLSHSKFRQSLYRDASG